MFSLTAQAIPRAEVRLPSWNVSKVVSKQHGGVWHAWSQRRSPGPGMPVPIKKLSRKQNNHLKSNDRKRCKTTQFLSSKLCQAEQWRTVKLWLKLILTASENGPMHMRWVQHWIRKDGWQVQTLQPQPQCIWIKLKYACYWLLQNDSFMHWTSRPSVSHLDVQTTYLSASV